MGKIRNATKKNIKRIGRAFGFSEVQDRLAVIDENVSRVYAQEDIIKHHLSFVKYYYYNEAAKRLHRQLFESYRNIYEGKDVVLVACGPSLDYYRPIPNAIHVAINRSFLVKKVKYDYIFMHDNIMYEKYKKELRAYNAEKFVAFATSDYNAGLFNMTTEQVDYIGAKRFLISDASIPHLSGGQFDVINPDIADGVLYDRGGGTVFSALQFILFTKPKHIFLVGCDCTEKGYFSGAEKVKQHLLPDTERLWKESCSFVRQYYPETKIYSVNPVRLKGLFEDFYTESFISKNQLADIKRTNILK